MQSHFIRARIITFFSRISYGIVLGIMQLILLYLLGTNHLNVTTVIIVGLVLYFVISGLAGLRSARYNEPVASGMTIGLVTGLTCLIIVMLTLVILAILSSIFPPPPSPPGRFYISPSLVVTYVIMMTLAFNLIGIFVALIGGGLGGFIGRRIARSSRAL